MLADWDPKLITPGRALALAGDWPVYYTVAISDLSQFDPEAGGEPQSAQWQINQRCGKCHQSITELAAMKVPNTSPNVTFGGPGTNTGDQLSDVLRHMVTAHNQSLSGAPDG